MITGKSVLNAIKKVGEGVLTVATIAGIVEIGGLAGDLVVEDTKFVVNGINKAIHPTEMRKRHPWSKPEEFDIKAGVFVADKKAKNK